MPGTRRIIGSASREASVVELTVRGARGAHLLEGLAARSAPAIQTFDVGQTSSVPRVGSATARVLHRATQIGRCALPESARHRAIDSGPRARRVGTRLSPAAAATRNCSTKGSWLPRSSPRSPASRRRVLHLLAHSSVRSAHLYATFAHHFGDQSHRTPFRLGVDERLGCSRSRWRSGRSEMRPEREVHLA